MQSVDAFLDLDSKMLFVERLALHMTWHFLELNYVSEIGRLVPLLNLPYLIFGAKDIITTGCSLDILYSLLLFRHACSVFEDESCQLISFMNAVRIFLSIDS